MNWRKITSYFIVIATVVIIGYDIAAAVWGQGFEATISSVLLDYSKEYPIISFALGVVAGHLFWPNVK